MLIENFRPGTLERWGLGPNELHGANPRLVIARVTAFGQFGPLATQPGFGSIAEAMSGFAAITGEPDGPPTLPPFGLADGIAALATSFAVTAALRSAEATGRGQVVDVAIIEPILMLLGAQITTYDQLGQLQQRLGNRSVNNAPRNVYRTADGEWVAVSTSSQSIAERVMRLVGRPDLVEQPWFATGRQRAEHADELDDAVGRVDRGAADRRRCWPRSKQAEAAIGPVYDVRGVMSDPQYAALGTVQTVDDDELGPVKMQNVLFRLSATPGSIRWAGRPHGADTAEVLAEIGVDAGTNSPSCVRRASCDGPEAAVVTALYVPGDRPERFAKAVATGAQLVILDLEDAVAAGHKDAARQHVVDWLASAHEKPPVVEVRVNAGVVGRPRGALRGVR